MLAVSHSKLNVATICQYSANETQQTLLNIKHFETPRFVLGYNSNITKRLLFDHPTQFCETLPQNSKA